MLAKQGATNGKHLGHNDEMQYLEAVDRIIREGECRTNRTSTPTRSIFGMQFRYSLRNMTIPVFTTKRVFWSGVVKELLWFIRGCTDAKALSSQGVHIWDRNADRAFLDNLGFHNREEGDLGPVYGFQWRHFGAKYVDCRTDYSGQGIDQLQKVLDQIRSDPDSRRILLVAWNPLDLAEMVLPPCHTLCQFYVSTAQNTLSCQLYQRSADMGLGVPFNVASYSLLTHILARLSGLNASEFIHSIGDAHVYEDHILPLKEQISRIPRDMPTVEIGLNAQNGLDDVTEDKIVLRDYNPLPKIEMRMAV